MYYLVNSFDNDAMNWANYNLTNEQILYAFYDTVMCLEIAKAIKFCEIYNNNLHHNCSVELLRIRKREDEKCCNNNLEDDHGYKFKSALKYN